MRLSSKHPFLRVAVEISSINPWMNLMFSIWDRMVGISSSFSLLPVSDGISEPDPS